MALAQKFGLLCEGYDSSFTPALAYVEQGKKRFVFWGDRKLCESADTEIVESIDKLDLTEREGLDGQSYKTVKNGRWVVEGPYQRSDVKNVNQRVYKRKIWERIVADPKSRVQQTVKARGMIGHFEHPADGRTDGKQGALVITKLALKPDGVVWGESELLDTPNGLILQEYTRKNVRWGVSSRGNGSVDSQGFVNESDYELETFDAVMKPSTPGAYPRPVGSPGTNEDENKEVHRDVASMEEARAILYKANGHGAIINAAGEKVHGCRCGDGPVVHLKAGVRESDDDTVSLPELVEEFDANIELLGSGMDESEQTKLLTSMMNRFGNAVRQVPEAKASEVVKSLAEKMTGVIRGLAAARKNNVEEGTAAKLRTIAKRGNGKPVSVKIKVNGKEKTIKVKAGTGGALGVDTGSGRFEMLSADNIDQAEWTILDESADRVTTIIEEADETINQPANEAAYERVAAGLQTRVNEQAAEIADLNDSLDAERAAREAAEERAAEVEELSEAAALRLASIGETLAERDAQIAVLHDYVSDNSRSCETNAVAEAVENVLNRHPQLERFRAELEAKSSPATVAELARRLVAVTESGPVPQRDDHGRHAYTEDRFSLPRNGMVVESSGSSRPIAPTVATAGEFTAPRSGAALAAAAMARR